MQVYELLFQHHHFQNSYSVYVKIHHNLILVWPQKRFHHEQKEIKKHQEVLVLNYV